MGKPTGFHALISACHLWLCHCLINSSSQRQIWFSLWFAHHILKETQYDATGGLNNCLFSYLIVCKSSIWHFETTNSYTNEQLDLSTFFLESSLINFPFCSFPKLPIKPSTLKQLQLFPQTLLSRSASTESMEWLERMDENERSWASKDMAPGLREKICHEVFLEWKKIRHLK